MKTVTDKNGIPTIPHYAVLEFDSIYIEGDERSRTNPGHGYPGHHQSVVNYIVFNNETELNVWVQKQHESRYGNRDNWTIIHATPKSVKVEAKIV